jgi:parallel beta-helix repeat protein
VVINGRTAHLLDNQIAVPEPERTNSGGHPSFAIAIFCARRLSSCDGNVIARNRVEGHPDGITIRAAPGASARDNVIRDNSIAISRVAFLRPWSAIRIQTESDSTIVGIPLTLESIDPADLPVQLQDRGAVAGVVENNRIEGNRIIGAEGLGIQVIRASRNRIANNTITGIALRDPFPGNTRGDDPEDWRKANGSGIWLSPGSDENEIVGNTFADVAFQAIVLQGDRSIVTTSSASHAVRDLGTDNRVTGPNAR